MSPAERSQYKYYVEAYARGFINEHINTLEESVAAALGVSHMRYCSKVDGPQPMLTWDEVKKLIATQIGEK